MIIVSLKQTSPGRVTICTDDGGEIRSTPGVVTELRLFTGCELDGHDCEAAVRESARALAREKALEYLSQRPMSAKELGRKLRDKSFDEATADYCVQWVLEHGFLHEDSYAAAIVRHYSAKGYGAGRIRQELMRRGVPRDLWEEALAAMPEDTSKIDRYVSARLSDPSDRDAVRKLSASLYRRGFSSDEIRGALDRASAAYQYEE